MPDFTRMFVLNEHTREVWHVQLQTRIDIFDEPVIRTPWTVFDDFWWFGKLKISSLQPTKRETAVSKSKPGFWGRNVCLERLKPILPRLTSYSVHLVFTTRKTFSRIYNDISSLFLYFWRWYYPHPSFLGLEMSWILKRFRHVFVQGQSCFGNCRFALSAL